MMEETQMKKLTAFILALIMALSLAACGDTAKTPNKDNTTKEPDGQSEAPGNPMENSVAIILQEGGLGDEGYNDGAKIGLDRMTEKYGVSGTLVEAAAASEADTFIRQLAEDGYPLIICLDWTIIDFVKAASVDYPDTLFVVLGKSLPGPGTQANLIEPYTALHERGFLMGMVSILVATDGNEIVDGRGNDGCKVAIMTAGESINHNRNTAAYQQARAEFNPDAVVVNDTTGHKTDAALNQTIAENLIKNQGVEIIWPNIGTGSLSVYTTCALNNAFALGIDINQDALEPGTIVTSGLHDTTYMVIDMIERWKAGNLVGTDEIYWGIESGVVGITDMSTMEAHVTNKENWERIKATINDYVEKIKSGEFVVYNYFVEDQVLFDDWQAEHPDVNYSEWVNAGRPA